MAMPDHYTFADGHVLRVVHGDVEIQAPGDGSWTRAPLRRLAREHAVGEGPWPWLRERGVRRPSPSGKSGTNIPEAQRGTEQVKLRLSADVVATLRARAEAEGLTLSAYVARLVTIDARRV